MPSRTNESPSEADKSNHGAHTPLATAYTLWLGCLPCDIRKPVFKKKTSSVEFVAPIPQHMSQAQTQLLWLGKGDPAVHEGSTALAEFLTRENDGSNPGFRSAREFADDLQWVQSEGYVTRHAERLSAKLLVVASERASQISETGPVELEFEHKRHCCF